MAAGGEVRGRSAMAFATSFHPLVDSLVSATSRCPSKRVHFIIDGAALKHEIVHCHLNMFTTKLTFDSSVARPLSCRHRATLEKPPETFFALLKVSQKTSQCCSKDGRSLRDHCGTVKHASLPRKSNRTPCSSEVCIVTTQTATLWVSRRIFPVCAASHSAKYPLHSAHPPLRDRLFGRISEQLHLNANILHTVAWTRLFLIRHSVRC